LNLEHKRRVLLLHIPNDSRNVEPALVIRNNNQRNVGWNLMFICKGVSRSQQVSTSQNTPIEPIHTFFMGLISKNIE
ncbi:MAG: hypothetical protein AAFU74_01520, partial [Bacteroidota bacterium]